MASIHIARTKDEVHLEIRDEGKGIAPGRLSEAASSKTLGVGIRGMRERIRQLGGTLEIDSNGLGKGTLITARLPLADLPAKAAAASAAN